MNNKRLLSPFDMLFCGVSKNDKTVVMVEKEEQFPWSKFKTTLDESLEIKLASVAKKSDIAALQNELKDIKAENIKLKNEVNLLTASIEAIDRKARVNNIIVSGIDAYNVKNIKSKFKDICCKTLNIDINVSSAKMLNNRKSVLLNLNSVNDVQSIIAAKNKFKDKAIFVQKDFTVKEQHIRYKLRTLSKEISKIKNNINFRLGEFCIFINDKKFG